MTTTNKEKSNKEKIIDYLITNYSGILEFEQGGGIWKDGEEHFPYSMQFEDAQGDGAEYFEAGATSLAIIDDDWKKLEELDLISGKLSQIAKIVEDYFGPGHISWVDFKNNNYKILTKEEVACVIESLFRKYKIKKSFHRGKYEYILTTGDDKNTDFEVTYSRCGIVGSNKRVPITDRYSGCPFDPFSKSALTEEIFNYFKCLGVKEISKDEIASLLFRKNINYI